MTGGFDLERNAFAPGQSGAEMHREKFSRPVPAVNSQVALGFTAANSLLVPEPLQSGGTQVIVNFDDVAPGSEIGNHYPRVVFSSPGRVVVAYDYWARATSPQTTMTPFDFSSSEVHQNDFRGRMPFAPKVTE